MTGEADPDAHLDTPTAALRPPDTLKETTVTLLVERLRARPEDAGLLDVAYTTMDSPVGTLLLAATPIGLVRLAYASEDHDAVLTRLAGRIGPRVLRAPRRLDAVRAQLEEYFTGTRRAFDVALDLHVSTGFRRRVLTAAIRLPYGTTTSYSRLAAATGNPTAVRATGTALATNPIPIVVPCHRLLRADGTLGGYIGGPHAKIALLDLERRAA